MWVDESESAHFPVSAHAKSLALALASRGLRVDAAVQAQVRSRTLQFGCDEWTRLADCKLIGVKPSKARRLLGVGFALTEFLVAPVLSTRSVSEICSLGALVNLMAVLCDGYLDAGVLMSEILPDSSQTIDPPVSALLKIYKLQLQRLQPDPAFLSLVEKLLRSMIAAETQTVILRHRLPYRLWLRKSAFPIVLMGLPVWALPDSHPATLQRLRYIRWLAKVGRFLGVIDDAADYEADLASNHPNYFNLQPSVHQSDLGTKIAFWCEDILREWNSLVTNGPEADVMRATFLNVTWAWLQPS